MATLSVSRNRPTPWRLTKERGAADEGKAERLNGLEFDHARALASGPALAGARLDLEVGQQVVGQDHEVLPSTVRGVGLVGTV